MSTKLTLINVVIETIDFGGDETGGGDDNTNCLRPLSWHPVQSRQKTKTSGTPSSVPMEQEQTLSLRKAI